MKILRLYNTIKFLKIQQIYFRIYYFIRSKFLKKEYTKPLNQKVKPLIWADFLFNAPTLVDRNTFDFLNLKKTFYDNIDWNYSKFGKLWLYNLNYFDFLIQENINPQEALLLIKDYISKHTHLTSGKDAYPTSLRSLNWIKFLCKNNIQNQNINQYLYNGYQRLIHNLEYHLLGNHLLENAFSLLFGAYYFRDDGFYAKAKKILEAELEEQILSDGAHFELSPMYHQILFRRLLDCIRLLENNKWKNDDGLCLVLRKKASKMGQWLEAVTFKNGDIPMVNDSGFGISANSQELLKYAKYLNLPTLPYPICLEDSGYRKINTSTYELFIDFAKIGPDYIPGHAHSDTLNFILYKNQKPFIVDTGISTYENNPIRAYQRSTSAHNTVQIAEHEQSEVWHSFRVARRAYPKILEEKKGFIKASHDGYEKIKCKHIRSFKYDFNTLIVKDQVFNFSKKKKEAKAFFHFYPDIKLKQNGSEIVCGESKLIFKNYHDIKIVAFDYALGFNHVIKAKKIIVTFIKDLETSIYL